MIGSKESDGRPETLRRRDATAKEISSLLRRGQVSRLHADGSRITGAICLDCCARDLRTKAMHGDLGEFDSVAVYTCPKCGSEDLFLEMACGAVV